jgi:hypothetical protein
MRGRAALPRAEDVVHLRGIEVALADQHVLEARDRLALAVGNLLRGEEARDFVVGEEALADEVRGERLVLLLEFLVLDRDVEQAELLGGEQRLRFDDFLERGRGRRPAGRLAQLAALVDLGGGQQPRLEREVDEEVVPVHADIVTHGCESGNSGRDWRGRKEMWRSGGSGDDS